MTKASRAVGHSTPRLSDGSSTISTSCAPKLTRDESPVRSDDSVNDASIIALSLSNKFVDYMSNLRRPAISVRLGCGLLLASAAKAESILTTPPKKQRMQTEDPSCPAPSANTSP